MGNENRNGALSLVCIISPLLLFTPEVARHASARNCNSTEWQFPSLPPTNSFYPPRFMHPCCAHTRLQTHAIFFLPRTAPFWPSLDQTYLSDPLPTLSYLFILRYFLLRAPIFFFVLSAPFCWRFVRSDYRRFELLMPRGIEPYTSFILKQSRALLPSWCRCRMRPLITCSLPATRK